MNKNIKKSNIDNKNNYKDVDPTDMELNKMMQEENVKNEIEFENKFLEDWEDTVCYACYKTVKLTKAVFINEAPYHKWCAEELGLM